MKFLRYEAMPMTVATYTVSLLDTKFSNQMIKWIDEDDSDGRVWIGRQALYFELEQDASHFALRWL